MRRRESGREWGRRADLRLPLVLLLASGCAPTADLHPEFDRLKPGSVAVLPVKNATIHQLDQVSFGGPVQRTFLGAATYDIPALLRSSLDEGLRARGYRTAAYTGRGEAASGGTSEPDFRHRLPEGAEKPPFDAALYTTIETWRAQTFSSPSIYMRYRVEMYKVPTGELLYSIRTAAGSGEDARGHSAEEVASQIRTSARRALLALPRAAE